MFVYTDTYIATAHTIHRLTRSTQTVLTSRGLLVALSSDSSVEGAASVTSGCNAPKLPSNAKSVATQATPVHPASLVSARLSTGSESFADEVSPIISNLPRFATSFGSSSVTPPLNEITTLTTDYESRCSDNHSLVAVQFSSSPDDRIDSPPPTLFYEPPYRPRRPRGVERILRILSCQPVERYVDDVDESDRRPPSYSTLFPIFRESSNVQNNLNSAGFQPVLIDNRSSFVVRTPPPSYAQAQGICVAYSLEQLVSNSENDGRMWSPRPTTAVCPRCATLVITVVDVQQTTATHVMAFTLFLIGCWPCCMLPYCIDSCKISHHYCPFCRTYLGTYTP